MAVTAATRMRERNSALESEISKLAYRLWVEAGCPAGSERADWFRAEAMLQAKSASNPAAVAIAKPRVECSWRGYWSVWEREWGGARWIWDSE